LSEKKIDSNLAVLIMLVSIVFIVVEVFVWTGQLRIDALGNLGYGLDKLLDNPAFVGLIETLIVGTCSGFMQNVFKKNDTFSLQKFGETFYYYMPLLIMVGQFLPVKFGAVILFVIDVFRRVFLKLAPIKS
jgi:hypothetical protein